MGSKHSKKKRTKISNNQQNKKGNIKFNANEIDEKTLTQAIVKAYQIIEENKKLESQDEYDKQVDKEKWYIKALFMLNVIFFPWKVHKRFTINNQIYDSILVLFVSLILGLFGAILWVIGLFVIVYAVTILFKGATISGFIGIIGMSIVVMMFGSIFTLAAHEFSKVSDSNRIYAYSASIIALISCIVAILTLLKEFF